MKSGIKPKRIILTVIIFVGITLFGISIFIPTNNNQKSTLNSNVITLSKGYGYQILNGDKVLIQQEIIPAIAGQQSFKTAKDAEFVANLVLTKLSKGDSPVLNIQDIDRLALSTLAKK